MPLPERLRGVITIRRYYKSTFTFTFAYRSMPVPVLLRISICFFVPVFWILRRESSGYTFATTTQMYEVF